MRKFLLRVLSFALSILILLTALLSMPSVKRQLKILVEDYLSHNSGFEVQIDSLSGAPPFFFTLNGVEAFHTSEDGKKCQAASMSTIRVVPAWLDILFTRPSFYHVQIAKLAIHAQNSDTWLNQFYEKNSQDLPVCAYLPKNSLAVYSFTFEELHLP